MSKDRLNYEAGDRLAKWRTARGWQQATLAEALGITQAAVSALENGHRAPSLQLAADIQRLTDGCVMAGAWVREIAGAEHAES